MGLLFFCMIVVASVGFYFFSYIDAGLIIFFTAQYLLCINMYNQAIQVKYYYKKYCLYLSVAALIGYVSAFRMLMPNIQATKGKAFDHFLYLREWIHSTFNNWNAEHMAQSWYDKLRVLSSQDTSALIIALFTGRRQYMHLAFSDLIRRTGISHLLALSGFHLSLLLTAVRYGWNAVGYFSKHSAQKKIIAYSSILIVWAYCILIGYIPSLYRAAIMYTISTIIKLLYGKSSFIFTWSITGLILLSIVPEIMYSHGFILSMLALLGVVVGARCSIYFYGLMPPFIASVLCMGIGAMLCTAWYSYLVFGACYPIGLIASILLTPFIALFMLLGILFLCFVYLSPIIFHITTIFSPILYLLTLYSNFLDQYTRILIRMLSYFSRTIVFDTGLKTIIFYAMVLSVILVYMSLRFVKKRLRKQ